MIKEDSLLTVVYMYMYIGAVTVVEILVLT